MNPVLQRFLSAHPGRDFDRDGLRLHYIDEGEGQPVVMLHGNPTWSFYYRHLIEDLRGSYRVIVPDHIGCGLSDKPDDTRYGYRLAERVDDLERLLDHLGLDRELTLVMHDWGGIIGMTFAARTRNGSHGWWSAIRWLSTSRPANRSRGCCRCSAIPPLAV